jgi:hypothetical protein
MVALCYTFEVFLMSDIVFTTDRLSARRWRASDVAALLAVYGDAEAMRWVGEGRPITLPECEQWLEVTQANYEKCGYGMFASINSAQVARVRPTSGSTQSNCCEVLDLRFGGLCRPLDGIRRQYEMVANSRYL